MKKRTCCRPGLPLGGEGGSLISASAVPHHRFRHTQLIQQRDKKRSRPRGSPQEDHAHPGDGGRGGAAEVVRLEQEVDVGAELDSLPRGHGQEAVVVQDGVERLDPLGVNVTVADDPRLNLCNINTLSMQIGQLSLSENIHHPQWPFASLRVIFRVHSSFWRQNSRSFQGFSRHNFYSFKDLSQHSLYTQ